MVRLSPIELLCRCRMCVDDCAFVFVCFILFAFVLRVAVVNCCCYVLFAVCVVYVSLLVV